MMQSDVIEADLNRITITDPFLGEYQRLIRDVVIPYQWEALNDNHSARSLTPNWKRPPMR